MKKVVKKIIIASILLFIFILLSIIKSNQVSADIYTRYIASNYFRVIGTIFSLLPFSLYELFLIGMIIYVIYVFIYVIRQLIKKEFNKANHKFINLLLTAFLIVDWYFAVASVGYGRSEVDIPLYQDNVSPSDIEATTEYFVNDFNQLSDKLNRDQNNKVIMPYSYIELNNKLNYEYNKLASKSNYFSNYNPRVKKLTFSSIFTELHITGVTFALNGETSVNKKIFDSELPFVMAHEMAHAKGVNREDDANLTALYICLNSDDDFIRYCAYYNGIPSFLDAYNTTFRKSFALKYPLRNEIYAEYNKNNQYWSEHDILAKIGNFYNDLFLKANGNDNGVNDYVDTSEKEDTGKVDENGQQIYIIKNYSPFQKLFFYYYFNN